MEEGTGLVRFTASLDPRAQEFRPNDPTHALLVPFFTPPQPPPQLYFPYNAPTLPPPPPLYHQRLCDLPFCPQYSRPPAFVSSGGTRTLELFSAPSDVSETAVRRELEVFGDVRGVQMERVGDGIVTVHFYDLRHAKRALSGIQEQYMHHQSWLGAYYSNTAPPTPPPPRGLILGASVWAQFTVPASNAVPDGSNQGTIVVFNLDPEVSTSSLKKIFGAFGEVKEVRETPLKRRQKFVEFFDIRDAAKALDEMNGKEIHGKCVVIQFSRPGGFNRKFFDAANCYAPPNSMYGAFHPPLPPSPQPPSPPPPPPPPLLLPHEFSGRFPRTISPPAYLSSQNHRSFPNKSSDHRKANPSVMEASIDGAIGKLSLSSAVEREISDKVVTTVSSKKSGKKNVETSRSKGRNRPWKGRHEKKLDIRFLINEEAITESNCKDSRTTVMIKNIPNKYR